MKFLTPEEKNALKLLTPGGSKLRNILEHMETGQFLHITREESTSKEGPKQVVGDLMKRRTQMQFVVHTIADRSGWVVERVK